jgi:FkbM family methyltransferase
MTRVNFDLAVRNAVKDHAQGAEAASAQPAAHAHDTAVAPGARSLVRRLLRKTIGPFADLARGFFTGPTNQNLGNVHVALHHSVVETAAQQQSYASLRFDLLTTQLLQTAAQVQQMAGRVRELEGRIDQYGPRFDELEIKVRPLIAFDDQTMAVRLAEGYVLCPRDEPVYTLMLANATSGGLEPGVRAVLQRLLRPGMIAADVGANIGLLSLVMARAVGPSGKLHSFECEPKARGLLERNGYVNGLHWMQVHPIAASAKAEMLRFHVSAIFGHSSLYALGADEPPERSTFEVKAAPLDTVLGETAKLDVAKIDVEGAELDVLSGMKGLLDANKDIALIAEFGPSHLERVGIAPEDWFAAFAAHGFDAYVISEPTGVAKPARVAELVHIESSNIAFVRPGGAATTRLTQR